MNDLSINDTKENSISKSGIPRDLKKIRSVIAKYKNKSNEMTNSSIESNVLKLTGVNRIDKDGNHKLGEIEYINN
jgi:predicted DNA-binding protein YlxM (UPF0122 family)